MFIKQLIKQDVANAVALEKQHGWLVALELQVKIVKEDGLTVSLLCEEVDNVKGCQFFKIQRDINIVSTAMTILDKNVWDSLDEVHLLVDALLQRTTMSPTADVQATPLSDLAPASQLAPTPTPAPSLVWAPDPTLAPDPTPATSSTPAPPPAPSQLPAHAREQMPAPHPRHPLFLDAHNQVNDCTMAATAQPPWNPY
jgi:hypothetical protein